MSRLSTLTNFGCLGKAEVGLRSSKFNRIILRVETLAHITREILGCLHWFRSMIVWALIDSGQNIVVNSYLNTCFHELTLAQDPDSSFH